MAEKQIEDMIKTRIKATGGWVIKLHADEMQGKETLDLMGGYRGRAFFVEVKAPDGVVSPMQAYVIERARQSGYVSGAVASLEEFENLFRNQRVRK